MVEHGFIQATISGKTALAERIFEFDIHAGPDRPPATPGAHIELMSDGFRRCYSVVENIPGGYRIAIQREDSGRGGSLALSQKCVGDPLMIRAPRNAFPVRETDRPALLIAGGIGITPILSMAHHLHEEGRAFELWYCARSGRDAAYVHRLRTAPFADRVKFHFAADTGISIVDFSGRLAAGGAGEDIYVCGPEGLLNHILSQARQASVPARRVHYELFGRTLPPGENDRAFTIELARSGIELVVAPDQTIYEALEERGIEVDVSCLSGTCATCLTPVLAGIPDHRDMVMTDEEKERGDQISICCSRSKSDRLVLDL